MYSSELNPFNMKFTYLATFTLHFQYFLFHKREDWFLLDKDERFLLALVFFSARVIKVQHQMGQPGQWYISFPVDGIKLSAWIDHMMNSFCLCTWLAFQQVPMPTWSYGKCFLHAVPKTDSQSSTAERNTYFITTSTAFLAKTHPTLPLWFSLNLISPGHKPVTSNDWKSWGPHKTKWFDI